MTTLKTPPQSVCPRCQTGRLKSWDELSEDERLLAESLPTSAEFSRAARRTHIFCTRCWFEEKPSTTTV